MPRHIKINGCGVCPYAFRYGDAWECRFVIGKIINHRKGWFAEECPLINENGLLLIADTHIEPLGKGMFDLDMLEKISDWKFI